MAYIQAVEVIEDGERDDNLLADGSAMKVPDSAQEWRDAMEATDDGMKVLENILAEENVPEKVAKVFFEMIGSTYTKGMCPLAHMEGVLAALSICALGGPERRLGMDLVTRFSRLARLADRAMFRRAGVGFQRLLRNPKLVDKIVKLHLGNKRGIVWIATEADVDADMRSGASIESVLDKLGISDSFEESWYQVVYNASDVGSDFHLPTVLDSGANCHFRPADKDAPHGMTRPISGGDDGYPEYVHGQCEVDQPAITLHICERDAT